MRSFDSLSEGEVLSLAVALEEEDERIYGDFADGLREKYPATADMFEGMRKEEAGHRCRDRRVRPGEGARWASTCKINCQEKTDETEHQGSDQRRAS